MKTPPKKLSQPELNRLFDEQNWEEKLKRCDRAEVYRELSPSDSGYPPGTLTVVADYFLDGHHIATISHHEDQTTGKILQHGPRAGLRSAKLLVIDSVRHLT